MNSRFPFCSPGMGFNTAGKQSLRLAPLWAGLAEAMHCPPACLSACGKPGRAAFMPSLESRWCDSFSVQIKCHWADLTATALFHPDGTSRARRLQVDVQVCWCCSFQLGAPSLPPRPSSSAPGRAAALWHRGRRNLHSQKFFYYPALPIWHLLRTLFSFPP